VPAPPTRAGADLLDEVNWTISLTLREDNERLGPAALDLPTLAAGWTARDLVLHLLLDAQRALVALAMTTDDPATVDECTYWRPHRPDVGDGGAAHARFVRAAAAAYDENGGLTALWRLTTHAAVNALRRADQQPDRRVTTQGQVLEPAEFASTLLVEATVHLLDLQAGRAGPDVPVAALAWTRRALEGIHEGPLPRWWDDREAVLKGTGRSAIAAADRAELGEDWRPLLG